MSSGFISHAVIKVSQTLAPWKACWPDEHNQIELSILNNGPGFCPLQRSLQAPINAQISFGLGRNLAFGLLSSSWNACCMAPFMRSGVRQTNVCRMSSRCYSLLHLKATDPRV